MLLSGGIGCSSQLQQLKNLLKAENRRVSREGSITNTIRSNRNTPYRIMSCRAAIRHMSQIEEDTRVDEGYVTGVYMLAWVEAPP